MLVFLRIGDHEGLTGEIAQHTLDEKRLQSEVGFSHPCLMFQ